MADTQRKNLLRDLASAARRDQETRQMSPARAVRLGLARAAAQLYELPLQVTDVKSGEIGIDDVPGICADGMLLALLDGPDGARGAIGLDRAMVAALIEVQVMGVVSRHPVPDRDLTPTDAAMVAPWLDAALERVDGWLEDEETSAVGARNSRWMIGYRFGAMAEDGRALALALDAPDYHILRVSVDVALGRRMGEVILFLPADPKAEKPHAAPQVTAQESFLEVPAELRVIGARMVLPLSRAGDLKPGDLLPIDAMFFDAAELRSVDGTLAGKARLGRLGEHWAVRFGGAGRSESPPLAAPPAMSGIAELQDAPSAPAPRVVAAPTINANLDLPDLPSLDFDDPPSESQNALVHVNTSNGTGTG